MKRHQLQFSDPRLNQIRFFGGSLTTTRAHRVARPISTKKPMHLVLRSSIAKGPNSFLAPQNNRKIKAHLIRLSRKFGVKIQNAANVGNHIHLVLKLSNRRAYKPFICAVTGSIARTVIQQSKGSLADIHKFWDFRPYSRIIEGLRAFRILRDYLLINRLQALGVRRDQVDSILVRSG